MRLFNFVNFENLLHMKPDSLLILNKLQKRKNGKAPKKTKLALFPRRILSCKQGCLLHTAHPTTDSDHLRRHDQSNHMITSTAAALNWSGNAMLWGVSLQHRFSAQRCLGFQRIHRNVRKNIFLNLKTQKNKIVICEIHYSITKLKTKIDLIPRSRFDGLFYPKIRMSWTSLLSWDLFAINHFNHDKMTENGNK